MTFTCPLSARTDRPRNNICRRRLHRSYLPKTYCNQLFPSDIAPCLHRGLAQARYPHDRKMRIISWLPEDDEKHCWTPKFSPRLDVPLNVR